METDRRQSDFCESKSCFLLSAFGLLRQLFQLGSEDLVLIADSIEQYKSRDWRFLQVKVETRACERRRISDSQCLEAKGKQ
jgi:hypothetical protein